MTTQTAVKTEVIADDCVRLTCSLPAAPSKVYEAWTMPEALAQWFAPEPGTKCKVQRFDLRLGGEFELALTMPIGEATLFGEFEILEPARRIGFSFAGCHDEAGASHVIVELTPEGSGTLLQLTDTRISSREQAESHAHGWTGCVGSLAQHLSV